MRPFRVESHIIDSVKDEKLPAEIPGFSPGVEFIRHLLSDCPGLIMPPQISQVQETLPFHDQYTNTELDQLSTSHARSFEIRNEAIPHHWQDEHGHNYTSLSLKGINFSSPKVFESRTAPDGVIPNGLQESSVIGRVLSASRVLRTNGISTEYILGLAEPKRIPWSDQSGFIAEMLPVTEYKRRIVEKHWRELPLQERTTESFVRLATVFEKMTFYVTARAMDSSIRLGELTHNLALRERAFAIYNENFLSSNEIPYSNTPEDLYRFIKTVHIPKIARNLAKLHNLGLAHRFPVIGNVTAFGSIVDLDSVHGPALNLGDDPISVEDKARDVLLVAESLLEVEAAIKPKLQNRPDLIKKFISIYLNSISRNTSTRFMRGASMSFAFEDLKYANDQDLGNPYTTKIAADRLIDYFIRHYEPFTITNLSPVYFQSHNKALNNALRSIKSAKVPLIWEMRNKFMKEIVADGNFALGDTLLDQGVKTFNKHLNALLGTIYRVLVKDQKAFYRENIDTREILESINWEDTDQCLDLIIRIQALKLTHGKPAQTLQKNISHFTYLAMKSIKDEINQWIPENTSGPSIDGDESYPVFSSTISRFAFATNHVPLEHILLTADKSNHRFTFDSFVEESDGYYIDVSLTNNEAVFCDIVSDDELNIYDTSTNFKDNPYNPYVDKIELKVTKNTSYVLVVEENTDSTKTWRFFIADKNKAEWLNGSKDPINAFIKTFGLQCRLFAPSTLE